MIVSDSDWHVLFLVIIQNLTRFQAVFQYLGKKTFPDFRFFFFFFALTRQPWHFLAVIIANINYSCEFVCVCIVLLK